MTTLGEANTCLANICSRKHKHTSTNTQTQAHELGHVPRDPTHIHRYTVFVWSHSRKKGQKKRRWWVVFWWRGVWVFCGLVCVLLWASRLRRGSVFWFGSRDRVLLSPHVSPFVEVGSRKPKFLADTMFLLVDVSSLLLHMT